MPTAAKRLCRCGGVISEGKCDRCARQKDHTRTVNPYNNARWIKFRAAYLADHPLCEDCEAKGLTTWATEVHHKKRIQYYPHLMYDEDNCRASCKKCHSKRTAKGE